MANGTVENNNVIAIINCHRKRDAVATTHARGLALAKSGICTICQILDESADTTSAINEEMVNTDLVNSELTAPSDLVEIVIPKTKEYTGRELFDNPRCPECTYWIDPETGKFRASQLSEIVTYEEEDYKLYREFKLSKKQIKDLEKAKEKGKFS